MAFQMCARSDAFDVPAWLHRADRSVCSASSAVGRSGGRGDARWNYCVSVRGIGERAGVGFRPLRKVARGASRGASDLVMSEVVLVVGASRGLGLELVRLMAFSSRYTVHGASTRSATAVTGIPAGATFHELDATNASSVADLIRAVEPDVIISCVSSSAAMDAGLDDMDLNGAGEAQVGAGEGEHETSGVDYVANKNLIDAACAMGGVTRFILVSALGAGDSEDSVPAQVKDNLRPILLDKSRAEKALRTSKPPLQYTILRPGPLTSTSDGTASEAGKDEAVVTESRFGYGPLDRRAFAVLIKKVLESESETSGKTFTAVDPKRVLLTSPYVRPLEFWEPLPFTPYNLK